MKNYLCWTPANARHVMNPDAEHLEDAVFLAVHTDHDLVLVDTTAQQRGNTWDERRRWSMPALDFVTEFLSPTRHQLQVAVLGQSGSGKSHFIHWLKLHIPTRDDQVVVAIPKTRTSLRGILVRLLEELPPDMRQPYQSRLEMAGNTLSTPDEQKNRLLTEIAHALPHVELLAKDENEREIIHYLRQELPNLFHDPHMRSLWKSSDGIIEQLVAHIVSSPLEYQRVDERRQFVETDLPLNAREMVHMSATAQAVIRNLLDDALMIAMAVRVINASLDEAIMQVLHFRGQQLLDMMLDIRRFLQKQGKGLILLIEDFAILQGIDVALLQSLNESSGIGDDALCDLRWAMAVTRGYYDALPDTVKTRMDYVIDMDLPTSGALSIMPDTKLVDFGARYLNAARLDKVVLNEWSQRQTSKAVEAVPNPCSTCTFQSQCHASFGANEDGIGFYPFNRRALVSMAERQDVLSNDRFNPRRFIKRVLANVLDTHSRELEEGRFPSKLFRDEMRGSGSGMSPQLANTISMRHKQDEDRFIGVELLWGSAQQLDQLPDGLYVAFNLPIPAFGIAASANAISSVLPTPHASPIDTPVVANTAAVQDKIIVALHNWSNGAILPEAEADALRDYVYDAICGFIDWDAEGLARSRLTARTTLYFRKRYIRFVQQQTQSATGPVTLGIPLIGDDASMRQAAIALEGLHRFAQTGDWTFENGFESLMALNACLEDWAQELIPQFRRVFQNLDTPWQPIEVATEVLVTTALLTGMITSFDIEPVKALNALFESSGSAPQLPDAWKGLVENLKKDRTVIQGILVTWATSTKGGRLGKLLRPYRIMPHLERFLKKPRYTELPNDIAQSGEYDTMLRLHKRLRDKLPKLLEDEFTYRQQWYQKVTAVITEKSTYPTLVQSIVAFQATYSSVGNISRSRSLKEKFDSAFSTFQKIKVTQLINTHNHLNRDKLWGHLPLLARRPDRLDEVTEFLDLLQQVIEEAEYNVAATFSQVTQSEEELKADMDAITQNLNELEQVLSQMEVTR